MCRLPSTKVVITLCFVFLLSVHLLTRSGSYERYNGGYRELPPTSTSEDEPSSDSNGFPPVGAGELESERDVAAGPAREEVENSKGVKDPKRVQQQMPLPPPPPPPRLDELVISDLGDDDDSSSDDDVVSGRSVLGGDANGDEGNVADEAKGGRGGGGDKFFFDPFLASFRAALRMNVKESKTNSGDSNHDQEVGGKTESNAPAIIGSDGSSGRPEANGDKGNAKESDNEGNSISLSSRQKESAENTNNNNNNKNVFDEGLSSSSLMEEAAHRHTHRKFTIDDAMIVNNIIDVEVGRGVSSSSRDSHARGVSKNEQLRLAGRADVSLPSCPATFKLVASENNDKAVADRNAEWVEAKYNLYAKRCEERDGLMWSQLSMGSYMRIAVKVLKLLLLGHADSDASVMPEREFYHSLSSAASDIRDRLSQQKGAVHVKRADEGNGRKGSSRADDDDGEAQVYRRSLWGDLFPKTSKTGANDDFFVAEGGAGGHNVPRHKYTVYEDRSYFFPNEQISIVEGILYRSFLHARTNGHVNDNDEDKENDDEDQREGRKYNRGAAAKRRRGEKTMTASLKILDWGGGCGVGVRFFSHFMAEAFGNYSALYQLRNMMLRDEGHTSSSSSSSLSADFPPSLSMQIMGIDLIGGAIRFAKDKYESELKLLLKTRRRYPASVPETGGRSTNNNDADAAAARNANVESKLSSSSYLSSSLPTVANVFDSTSDVSFCHADGTDLSFISSATFDYVTAFGALLHVPAARLCATVGEMLRVVRVGGAVWGGYIDDVDTIQRLVNCSFGRDSGGVPTGGNGDEQEKEKEKEKEGEYQGSVRLTLIDERVWFKRLGMPKALLKRRPHSLLWRKV